MFWSEDVPRLAATEPSGARAEVACVAGRLADASTILEPPAPPPDSWAASVDSDVAIWTVRLDPGARWTLPPARGGQTRRNLYFFVGDRVSVGAPCGAVATERRPFADDSARASA